MKSEEQIKDVWEFLELPNNTAPEAQALYSWGLNCDREDNPFLVFLDLIGLGEDEGVQYTANTPRLGYTELGYLADALNEYADNPHGVTDWLTALMGCENV